MRICPKCGFKIENDEAKFCKKCGSSLPAFVKNIEIGTVRSSNDNGITLHPQSESEPLVQIHTKRIVGKEQQGRYGVSDFKRPCPRNMVWAVKTCFSKYAKFEGRASRSEYWYFVLFNLLVFFMPVLLACVIDHDIVSPILFIVAFIYLLVAFLPGLSVSVRRLHDVGKSGYFYFINFIPYIGGFILLYYFCKASEIGRNMYGETN